MCNKFPGVCKCSLESLTRVSGGARLDAVGFDRHSTTAEIEDGWMGLMPLILEGMNKIICILTKDKLSFSNYGLYQSFPIEEQGNHGHRKICIHLYIHIRIYTYSYYKFNCPPYKQKIRHFIYINWNVKWNEYRHCTSWITHMICALLCFVFVSA